MVGEELSHDAVEFPQAMYIYLKYLYPLLQIVGPCKSTDLSRDLTSRPL